MPKEMRFVLFLQLYSGFSYISFGEIFQIFTAYHIQRDTNFKHNEVEFVKAVFCYIFLEINFFYYCKKTGLIDFPEKQAPTKANYSLQICQVLWNLSVLLFVLMLTS